jgi:hypothetical protein
MRPFRVRGNPRYRLSHSAGLDYTSPRNFNNHDRAMRYITFLPRPPALGSSFALSEPLLIHRTIVSRPTPAIAAASFTDSIFSLGTIFSTSKVKSPHPKAVHENP